VGEKAPYEGGAWAIGGVLSKSATRPARPSLRWLLARQAQIREYMAHIEAAGGWLAAEILAYYRAELAEHQELIKKHRADRAQKRRQKHASREVA